MLSSEFATTVPDPLTIPLERVTEIPTTELFTRAITSGKLSATYSLYNVGSVTRTFTLISCSPGRGSNPPIEELISLGLSLGKKLQPQKVAVEQIISAINLTNKRFLFFI